MMQSQKSQKNQSKTITQELDEQSLIKEFKHKNIIKERVELYKDFIISLTCKVHNTYFGHAYLKNENDFDGHFKWCFNKVVDEYKQEGFNFYTKGIYKELCNYIYTAIYYLDDNEIEDIECMIKWWESLFKYSGKKTQTDLEYFLELYEMFNEQIEIKH